ncbi:MAG: diaminopimelate epimerase [Clostridia bacterium]|nr:diaminopimelate epimerase [Clostridia bacterium]
MLFTKMQGLGNDYLYVYGSVPENIKDISTSLSDRHFGAGADGMIFISPSNIADFSMRIFNADGSEAKMCGNGIRCVGKYVYDKGYTDKTRLKIETLSGIRNLKLNVLGGRVKSVTVDMGQAEAKNAKTALVGGEKVTYIPVNVGNPHAVIFVNDTQSASVNTIGQKFQKLKDFPGGVNVEFAQIMDENNIRMRVYERGSGITMACGTGACAAVAAAVKQGLVKSNSPVFVTLDGGKLEITVFEDFSVKMTGPAQTVYEGEANI